MNALEKKETPPLSIQLLEDLGGTLAKAVLATAVASVDDANRLTAMGRSLKSFVDMVNADKDRFCKPLNKISRDYAAPRNAIVKALKPALDHVRSEPVRFRATQVAAQKELLQHAAATGAGPAEIERAVALTVPEIEGHRESTHWVAIVENPALVPEQYKMILQGELDREARKHKEAFSIPGCRVEKVTRGSIL